MTVNRFVTLALASLAGCAPFFPQEPPPSSSARVQAPQGSPHRLDLAPDQVDRAIGEAKLSCERGRSGGPCPQGVAMLLIREEHDRLSQCTGFLISAQTVMTNSHCLPKKLRRTGGSCTGITAVFPPVAHGETEERIACDSIEFASPIPDEGAAALKIDLAHHNRPALDVAVVHLRGPSQRAPIELDRRGISGTESLHAWVVDPISNVIPGGVLRRKTCRPVLDSVLAPDFSSRAASHETPPVAAFSGCTILHGNSGSPAFDDKGKARAVVFATLPSRELENKTRAGENRRFQSMSLMSNLACAPDAGAKRPTGCDRTTRQSPQLDLESARAIKTRVDRWLNEDGAGLAREFDFALTSIPAELGASKAAIDLIWSEPLCAREPRADSRSRAAQAAPIWQARFEVNEFYQPQVELLMIGSFNFEITHGADAAFVVRRKLDSSPFMKSLLDHGSKFETPRNAAACRTPGSP